MSKSYFISSIYYEWLNEKICYKREKNGDGQINED